MTDDELKALCESNARSTEANSSAIAALTRSMISFRDEMSSFRADLRQWVEVHNQISDDQGADLINLGTASNTHDAQVTALREAAIADRMAFREQAESDRRVFRDSLAADRAQWQASFQAQQEVLQRMLLEVRSTNGAVSDLSDRVDNLEQAS